MGLFPVFIYGTNKVGGIAVIEDKKSFSKIGGTIGIEVLYVLWKGEKNGN